MLGGSMPPCRGRAGERPLAPDFRLHDMKGISRKLSDFRGKVVLLNFWATWCAPCKSEIPVLNRLHRDYRARGFSVIAVAMDERGWAAITPFVNEFRIDCPVLLGNPAVARLYEGLRTLPSTLFLDRHGCIVASHDAALPEAHLRKIVETLLAESREAK
jgi:thiol-disulfide isomerase/thioredoxin